MIDQKKLENFAEEFFKRGTLRGAERFMVIALDKSVLAYGNGGAMVEVKDGNLSIDCGPGTAREGTVIEWTDEEGGGLDEEDEEDAPDTEDEEDALDTEDEEDEDDSVTFIDDEGENEQPDYHFRGLFYHVTTKGQGIKIKDDDGTYGLCPIVFWNTGKEDIRIGDVPLKSGRHRVLHPNHPLRREPREEKEAAFNSLADWTEKVIQKNKAALLAMGCPEADAGDLAGYFWRREIHPSRYNGKPHAEWMQDLWDECH